MANSCKNIRAQMAFYLDDELRNGERDEFEAHLNDCSSCRDLYEQERLLLELVRASQPLYQAPAETRARVLQPLETEPEQITAPYSLRRRIQSAFSHGPAAPNFHLSPIRWLGLTIVLLVFILAGLWILLKNISGPPGLPRPSDIAMMAV